MVSEKRFLHFECGDPDCHFRYPLDSSIHKGTYCPLCGAKAQRIDHPIDLSQGTPVSSPKNPCKISGLLDNLRSNLNVGACFRIADGAGLQHLYLCGITPSPEKDAQIEKTALGSHESIGWTYHRNAVDLSKELILSGVKLIALETGTKAVPLFEYRVDKSENCSYCLIIGNELAGIDPELLRLSEVVLSIPMQGKKESLNAAVAFGIAAYWLVSQQ